MGKNYECWEVEVRLSEKNLAKLMRSLIVAEGKLSDSYRQWKHIYENSKSSNQERVHILVQIPNENFEKFKELWGEEIWNHPVVSIPRCRRGHHEYYREFTRKYGILKHWNPNESL